MSSGYDTPDPSSLLPTFNPADMADRLQLSDAMDERGRSEEATLLRTPWIRVCVSGNRIRRNSLLYFWLLDGEPEAYLTVYVVEMSAKERFKRLFPKSRRLTVKEGQHIGYYLPRSRERLGSRATTGFVGGKWRELRNVNQAIGSALAHTEIAMQTREIDLRAQAAERDHRRAAAAAQPDFFNEKNGGILG